MLPVPPVEPQNKNSFLREKRVGGFAKIDFEYGTGDPLRSIQATTGLIKLRPFTGPSEYHLYQ